jgi:hypothetical protein
MIRLLTFSLVMTSKNKEKLLHIPEKKSAKSVQNSGPHYHPMSSGPSDLRGTGGTQLSHLIISLIVTMISKDQILPIHELRKEPLRINIGSHLVVTWEIKEMCKRGQSRRV